MYSIQYSWSELKVKFSLHRKSLPLPTQQVLFMQLYDHDSCPIRPRGPLWLNPSAWWAVVQKLLLPFLPQNALGYVPEFSIILYHRYSAMSCSCTLVASFFPFRNVPFGHNFSKITHIQTLAMLLMNRICRYLKHLRYIFHPSISTGPVCLLTIYNSQAIVFKQNFQKLM